MNQLRNRLIKLENGETVVLDYFTYQIPVFSNLAVGASNTQQVIVQANTNFEWMQAVYEFDLAAAAFTESTRPIPNCTVLIVDVGSGLQLMNTAVPVTSLFGPPNRPYILPITRTFKGNAAIQVTVNNFDAAVTTGNLRLSLIGLKQLKVNEYATLI